MTARGKLAVAFLVVGVVLAAGVGALWWYISIFPAPVPSKEDVWTPEHLLVIDSAQVPGSPKAYLFWYDAGTLGFTIRMVSLGVPTHRAPALVLTSEHITGIRWQGPHTLVVELDSAGYVASQPPQGIVVQPLVAPCGPRYHGGEAACRRAGA